jgi:hypothetical protein
MIFAPMMRYKANASEAQPAERELGSSTAHVHRYPGAISANDAIQTQIG